MISPLYGQLSPLRIPTNSRFISADSDVSAYILAVESADGQQLEEGVIAAVESFVLGCKSDGIWSAIKASCILAGARTLSGALKPLVGTAPTNLNFVSADYNRVNGLLGNGLSKSLDSNRLNSADPQNSKHISVFINTLGSQSRVQAGAGWLNNGQSSLGYSSNLVYATINNNAWRVTTVSTTGAEKTLLATNRANSTEFEVRFGNVTQTLSDSSQAPFESNISIFKDTNLSTNRSNARLAYYSIGESLDLALLDTRVSNLMTDLAAAIP